MRNFRRQVFAAVTGGVSILIYAIYIAWVKPEVAAGRTVQGRLFGVLALVAIISSLAASRMWRRYPERKEVWYARHLWLGGLPFCLILAHAGFHFINIIAILGAACLGGVVGSGFLLSLLDGQQYVQPGNPPRLLNSQPPFHSSPWHNRLWRYGMIVHIALSAGLLTFVFLHLLIVFYY
jgi:hypothetical protein